MNNNVIVDKFYGINKDNSTSKQIVAILLRIKCDNYNYAVIEASAFPSDLQKFYLNTMVVPVFFRKKGLSKKLLLKLQKIAEEEKIKIICEANPYGDGDDMNLSQLKSLFKKFGFSENPDGSDNLILDCSNNDSINKN